MGNSQYVIFMHSHYVITFSLALGLSPEGDARVGTRLYRQGGRSNRSGYARFLAKNLVLRGYLW